MKKVLFALLALVIMLPACKHLNCDRHHDHAEHEEAK